MCLELCLISSVHMEQPQIARGTKGRDGETLRLFARRLNHIAQSRRDLHLRPVARMKAREAEQFNQTRRLTRPGSDGLQNGFFPHGRRQFPTPVGAFRQNPLTSAQIVIGGAQSVGRAA
jgi:hypothetical protein